MSHGENDLSDLQFVALQGFIIAFAKLPQIFCFSEAFKSNKEQEALQTASL